MTKEEILTKIANDNSYSDWGEYMYDSHPHTQVEATGEAMEEYAKQKAIDFLVWVEKNGWWADTEDQEGKLFTSIRWSKDSAKPEYLTTEQLFDLFNTNKEV